MKFIYVLDTYCTCVCIYVLGHFAKILGISGDRGETEAIGARHKLLHRLLAAAADHREGHFRCAADLHSYGATCR